MRDVVKKSADPAVNQMLVKAHRQGVELAWDRAETTQPQCGFGRLAICCSDCFEGPCRVNPFEADGQATICGRDRAALTTRRFLTKASDGAVAMLKLAAEFGGTVAVTAWQDASFSDDEMMTGGGKAAGLGKATAVALEAIAAAKRATYGAGAPTDTSANLGGLCADRPNIVLHGHVPPAAVKALVEAAAAATPPLNVVALCGSEISGPLGVAVLTNYDSQEAALLTGAVDLLVLGSQCVMPSIPAMAARVSTAVVRAAEVADAAGVPRAIAVAVSSCARRQSRPADGLGISTVVRAGFTAENCEPLLQALAAAHAAGRLRGLVYLGGCGNLAHTQDADFVRTASLLIENGYLVVSAGCAGTALAKAGLCRPQASEGTRLSGVLPQDTPPVLDLGSCHDAGEFLAIAAKAAALKLPVFAVMQELTHNKVLATALSFGGRGIRTFLCVEEVDMPANALDGVTAFSSLAQIPQVIAEMARA